MLGNTRAADCACAGGERGERGFERVNAKVQREAREVRQVGVFERLEYQRAIRDIGVRPIVGQGQAQALRFGWRAARGRIRHGAGCGGGPHYDFKMHRQRNLLERGEVAGLLPFETRQQLRTHPRALRNGTFGVGGVGKKLAKLVDNHAFLRNTGF